MIWKLPALLLFVSVSNLLVSGCVNHREDIGYGLNFIDLSYQNYAIIDGEGSFIVYPRIFQYCKIGQTIHGFRVDPKGDNSDGSKPFISNLGYFELDVRTRATIWQPRLSLREFQSICGGRVFPKKPRSNSSEYSTQN